MESAGRPAVTRAWCSPPGPGAGAPAGHVDAGGRRSLESPGTSALDAGALRRGESMSQLRLVPVSGPPVEVNGPSMVGRDPSCEIVVTDGSVSRRHARLEPRGARGAEWWVVDQGSANGTFVNSV